MNTDARMQVLSMPWSHVTVRNPGLRALTFILRHARDLHTLEIESAAPQNTAWLLHGLRHAIKPRAILVRVHTGNEDVPSNFLNCCLNFAGVERVDVAVHNECYDFTEFNVASTCKGLATVTDLGFRETSPDDIRRYTLTFENAKVPVLRRANIDAFSSDFLDRLPPTIRDLRYLVDDGYLVLPVAGVALDTVELLLVDTVPSEHIFSSLRDTLSIQKCTFRDERVHPQYPVVIRARELEIVVHAPDTAVELRRAVLQYPDIVRIKGTACRVVVYGSSGARECSVLVEGS